MTQQEFEAKLLVALHGPNRAKFAKSVIAATDLRETVNVIGGYIMTLQLLVLLLGRPARQHHSDEDLMQRARARVALSDQLEGQVMGMIDRTSLHPLMTDELRKEVHELMEILS